MIRGVSFFVCWVMMLPSFAKGYQTFEEQGKVGMKDEAGQVVLPPTFEALGWSDGSFSVIGEVTGYRLHGSWGIVNLKKEFITTAAYEALVYTGGDCVVARKKINQVASKTGCITLKGEVKIPFIYDGISVQGLRAVVFNLKGAHYYFGLTDLEHTILIPVIYRNITPLGTLRFAVENSDHKIALFEDSGKPVTDFSIDSVSAFYKGYARIYQNHLQGLIDRGGIVKLESKYNSINIDSDGSVFTQLPNDWFFINDKNETVRQIAADEVSPMDETHYAVRMGKVLGVFNGELKPVITLRYDRLAKIEKDKYLAKWNSKMGVISENEEVVVPFAYDSLIHESNSYRAYNKNAGWQLLTPEGKKLTEKSYEVLGQPSLYGYPSESKGYRGLVNAEGREFIHCVFDSIAAPVDGLIGVKFKGNYGIINVNEDWVVAPQTFPLRVINAQRYLQIEPGNNFVKSLAGEIVYFTPYPMRFAAENFVETLPDGGQRTISYGGEVISQTVLPDNLEEVFAESEGFRGIKKDGRYGFIDERSRLRIANRYDSIGEFHDGLAAIKLIGKWGFVNTSDQIAINPNYDNLSFFANGLAIVSRNNKFGLIGKAGNIILPLRYDHISRIPSGKFLLITASLLGLADELGNVTVEPRFNSLQEAGNHFLLACRDKKWGAITEQGLSIVPLVYDQLRYIGATRLFLAQKKSAWKQAEMK